MEVFNYNYNHFDCFFWSRGISETYGFTLVRTSVRPSVHPYVHPYRFSEKSAHQIFMSFFMKPRLSNRKKVTVSLYGQKFKIGPFLAQNQCFLFIFSKWHIRFFWFFSWSLGFINVKNWPFHFFGENSKLALFCPKNGQNLTVFGQKTPFFKPFDLILTFLYSIFYMKYL